MHKTCHLCNAEIAGRCFVGGGKRYCVPCIDADQAQAPRWRAQTPTWRGSHKKRAEYYGGKSEDVDRMTVFERDQWTCGICLNHVDRELKYPDPLSASLDHVVPLSEGGDHVYSNCQLAHLGCNFQKEYQSRGERKQLIGR